MDYADWWVRRLRGLRRLNRGPQISRVRQIGKAARIYERLRRDLDGDNDVAAPRPVAPALLYQFPRCVDRVEVSAAAETSAWRRGLRPAAGRAASVAPADYRLARCRCAAILLPSGRRTQSVTGRRLSLSVASRASPSGRNEWRRSVAGWCLIGRGSTYSEPFGPTRAPPMVEDREITR
jgi:hypothetical protein